MTQKQIDAQAIAIDDYADLFDTAESEDHATAVTLAHDTPNILLPAIERFSPALAARIRALQAEAEDPNDAIRRLLATDLSSRMLAGVKIVEDPEKAEAPAERFLSTITPLDVYSGGFYGVTVIAGETGVGKSSLAIASALDASLAGWTVIYANSELDPSTIRHYLRRWIPSAALRADALRNFRLLDIRPGVTLRELKQKAREATLSTREGFPHLMQKLLIVIDSINTVAELTQSGEGQETYFAELRNWIQWAMYVRKQSGGLISAILVSEVNAKGETKGRKADYAADFVLHLHRGDMDGYVKARVTKGRYSGPQDLGSLYFDHTTGQFKGQMNGNGASNEPI